MQVGIFLADIRHQGTGCEGMTWLALGQEVVLAAVGREVWSGLRLMVRDQPRGYSVILGKECQGLI